MRGVRDRHSGNFCLCANTDGPPLIEIAGDEIMNQKFIIERAPILVVIMAVAEDFDVRPDAGVRSEINSTDAAV
jgi:hypothetical protein